MKEQMKTFKNYFKRILLYFFNFKLPFQIYITKIFIFCKFMIS